MADRKVTQSKKDKDGDILALCNPLAFWSPRWKADAIQDIESKAHTYYVEVGLLPTIGKGTTARVNVHVYTASDGKKHLRTDPDPNKPNNLDNLPGC